MPTERWERLERLFTEVVEQPAEARAAFLARTAGPDADLRDEIASLLTAVEHSSDFLAASALDVFARQIAREGWSVKRGDIIGSYTVEQRLGAGGIGEVWRARDERLGRDVAIKLLLPHPSNAEARMRDLQHEARAAGSLNHTNVLTVHDVGEHNGAPYLVTECLEGESLRARLRHGALSVGAALDIALQVTRGLGAAHERGIVHRDLKPENIFLGQDGRVKILDFGLATGSDSALLAQPSPESPREDIRSLVAGTAGYMAPEQVRGEAVDRRADIFAFGVVLFEMLTGERPFKGDSTLGTLNAVLTEQAPELSDLHPGIPQGLRSVVRRCLAKSPDDRSRTIGEVLFALEGVVRARNPQAPQSVLAVLRRPVARVTMLLLVLAIAALAWRWRAVTGRARWARETAAPEVQRLSNQGDYAEAFLLARQALDVVPDDPHLTQLWLDASMPAVVTTDPLGADVAIAPYRAPRKDWFPLGRTPLEGVRIPRGAFRVRITKAGFQEIQGAGAPGAMERYRLDPVGAGPPGMVRVVGGRDPFHFGPVGKLDDYWIDRFEVTNRLYKEFVDQGGYRRREYWREPFIEAGRSVPWDEAVARFRDGSGVPGPATWKAGTYADGQGELPVGGVSWYEAAAYAAFAGKSLPTMYHWYRAAAMGRFGDILTVSNFGEKGPSPVGSSAGLGPFGTYDMAGNVKEWCWNEADHRRFLLGGAWNEPMYMFADYDARGPFERAPGYGFRLAKYIRPLSPTLTAPVRIEGLGRDVRTQQPVTDDIFAVYRRQFAYDRLPLNAVVEATAEGLGWVRHTIAFDAAYGGERMRVFLFLPKAGSPPYQTVVYFPGGGAFVLRSSRDLSPSEADFIIRSGRALLYPVYKGTYERQVPQETGPFADRDLLIAWARDLGRAIDYLETRSDIDRARLAFYGVSSGADAGIILTALEPRLAASVLQGTGIPTSNAGPPESDPLNYAPRVRLPTLLLNGRYDFEVPFETSQRPLFDLLGSPPERKRHTVLPNGHALPLEDRAREILPWLDRYLGPVAP